MGKTLDYSAYGEDDRPLSVKYASVPQEVLDVFIEEGESNSPKTWEEAWKRTIDWEVENGVRRPIWKK